ncbi:MAG: aminodeoxychorismate synthase component I, partial [Pseudomonadota bacterium]|nr:aminodeoxychorismate synthase component I [Pseudomonadota bacterium]
MTYVLLDRNAGPAPGARLYRDPAAIVSATSPQEVASALSRMEALQAEGYHLAGYFSYELAYALEPRLRPLMPSHRNVPLLWFGAFKAPGMLQPREIEEFLSQQSGEGFRIDEISPDMAREDYRARFGRARSYITAGDIYQLNLTLKARFTFSGSPAALYRDLRGRQRVEHGALISCESRTILSLSPELFLEIADGKAITRPMKGTARRGRTLAEDGAIARWLAGDEKSRAENLMITDLMRNDLGRIAEIGSVRTPALFEVEGYETLHQMTSTVEARLRPCIGISDLVHALFPPGSVTGAPKVRAIEIIRDLETGPRSVYTGAIGAFTPDGAATFNVAIRTLTIDSAGRGEIGIGSGVVSDSLADDEYDECLLKMRFICAPRREFQLIETLRHDPDGSFVLLERHLDRLAESAAYFRFACDGSAVRGALAAESARLGTGEHHRTRLLLFKDGYITIASVRIDAPDASSPMRYVLSDRHIDSTDSAVFHKTTLRDLYDGEHARYAASLGSDEVLFLNERGEL